MKPKPMAVYTSAIQFTHFRIRARRAATGFDAAPTSPTGRLGSNLENPATGWADPSLLMRVLLRPDGVLWRRLAPRA